MHQQPVTISNLNYNTQLPHASFEVRQGLSDILGNSFASLIAPLKSLIRRFLVDMMSFCQVASPQVTTSRMLSDK
jgi:hypothetical protein